MFLVENHHSSTIYWKKRNHSSNCECVG